MKQYFSAHIMFWITIAYTFGSIAFLAFRYRKQLSLSVMQEAMKTGEEPKFPSDAKARLQREVMLLGNIGMLLFAVGAILSMFESDW